MSQQIPTVIVVGAGFGGLRVVKELSGTAARIVLIDRMNHHLFQPLLYQVATAGLSAPDIAYPIRAIFGRQRNVEVRMAEVVGVNPRAQTLQTDKGDLSFDYLVLSPGSVYHHFGHPQWAKVTSSLKSITDAVHIREEILLSFERAETETDSTKRERWMTFVLVGAGPTGVEMAGAMAELASRALSRDFRHIDSRAAKVVLLEAAPRILGAFPEKLAADALRRLSFLGVDVRVNAKVEEISEEGVTVAGGLIPAATVLWTAGVKASPIGNWLSAPTDKMGRVIVEEDLSVPGQRNVFMIGDAACVTDEKGVPLPGLAPVAMQEGKYVGRLIRSRLRGDPASTTPFRYRNRGNLATIGRGAAIADFGRFSLTGWIAWLAWLAVHIYFLIGFRNRVVVLFQWAWAYVTFQGGARLISTPSIEE